MAEGGGEEKASGGTPTAFISYASQDAAVAAALVEALERQGVACWIAPRDVKAGALYADAIVRAIGGANAFVLVLSESAIASSHVGKEIERASSKKRPIIALRIDSAPLTPALEYFLSESQWVEAQAGNIEAAYAKLIDAVHEPERTTSGSTLAASPGAPAGASPAVHSRSRRSRIFLAAGLAAIVVSLSTLFAAKFWLGSRVTAGRPATAASNIVNDKSIAVLPFTDMSEKKDQEYFGDGMAEEIVNLLVKIPGLTVIGRTSSFQFKSKNEDLRTIGTRLNAAYVLEGSVRKSGDQVRITAQLINTGTGTHEWSETYDRYIGDVLKLQDTIAAAVARELQLTVASGHLNSRETLKSAEAYDLMLRGRHAADRWDKDGLDEAITLFKQALDRDSTSADAAAELASALQRQGEEGFVAQTAAFEQARRAAETALRLDPEHALAHYVLGLVLDHYDWGWVAAEREFQLVATLAPSSANARQGEAELSAALGRLDDALKHVKAALVLDPLDPSCFMVLAEIQLRRGRLSEAEAAARRALDIRPTFAWAHYYLGLAKLASGDRSAGLVEMQNVTTDDGRALGLAIAYHALGRKAESDIALTRLLEDHSGGNAFNIANVYAFRGQPDEAMLWLERAYAKRDPNLFYIKLEMPMKSLEGDSRFKALLRKMNLPE